MRCGTWILAVSGAMALNAGGVFAADPVDPFRNEPAQVPTRYDRAGVPPSAPPKNYRAELFSATPETPRTGSATVPPAAPAVPSLNRVKLGKPTGAAATPTAPVVKPTTTTVAKPAAPQTTPVKTAGALPLPDDAPIATTKLPLSAPPTNKRIPLAEESRVYPASSEALELEKKVIHAGFDKQPGVSEKSFVQPVHNTPNQANRTASSTTAKPAEVGPQTPMVSVEWVRKSDLNVGQECALELVVKNTGTIPTTQVAVDATFPTTVRLTSAEPKPAAAGDKVTWSFTSLAPGVEQRISLKLIPSRRGDLGANASVRFTGQAASTFKVEEPQLKVALKGPVEVMLGDPASQMILVSNPGTGIAHDVKLEARLTDGLEHKDGNRLEILVGSIGPGDSQHIRLGLSTVKGGPQTVQVSVTSSCEASSATTAKINVIAPSLLVKAQGPGLRYKDRNAKYVITVSNDGTVPNTNVHVTHVVPEGFQFLSADRGGKYEPTQRAIHWFIGRMDAGQAVQLNCELTASGLGDFKHNVSVNSDSGVHAQTQVATRVEGTASLDTEIVDLDDPVEVGIETAWEVRVRNNGSKAATKIAVACELPAGVELISAVGATEAVADKKAILFKTLPQLAPGQQASYRVKVRGVAEGTHRLKARVSSDTLDQPVSIEEATKFYADAKN